MGTFIVLVVLGLIVFLIIRSMVKAKKNGKSISCGGDCKNCGGGCHQNRKNCGTWMTCIADFFDPKGGEKNGKLI